MPTGVDDINVWFEKCGRHFVAYAEAEVNWQLVQGQGIATTIRRAKLRALDELRLLRAARRRELRERSLEAGAK